MNGANNLTGALGQGGQQSANALGLAQIFREGDVQGTGKRMWRFTDGAWVKIPRAEILRALIAGKHRDIAEHEAELAAIEAGAA